MASELEDLLKGLRNQPVVYIPNPGNAGDSFIAHATYQLFARAGLNYEIGNCSTVYPDKIVICGGGGNLVKPNPVMSDFLKLNLGRWRQLIILPHTIRDYSETLMQFGSNCFVFCRERRSFAFVKLCAPNSTVLLSDDVALTCDLDETRRLFASRGFATFMNLRLAIRNAKCFVRAANYQIRNRKNLAILSCIRTDFEKTELAAGDSNIDISRAFAADDMLPISSLYATHWMMSFIDRFERVKTNRLHVAIMAAMLNKTVDFHDNSYGKNRDVFDYSINGLFPKVRWQSH